MRCHFLRGDGTRHDKIASDLSDNELERLDSNVFRNSSQSLKKLNLIGNGKLKSSKGKKLCEDEKDENDNIKYSKCMLCSPDYVDTDKTCNMDKGCDALYLQYID